MSNRSSSVCLTALFLVMGSMAAMGKARIVSDSDRSVYFDSTILATTSAHFNDVWAFDLAAQQWQEVQPAGILPPPTRNQAAAYDALNGRMIFSGGENNNQLWELDLTSDMEVWSNVIPVSGVFPSNLYGEDMFYHSGQKSLIAYHSNGPNNRFYRWNVETGVSETISFATKPAARIFPAMALDEVRNRLLLYGGGSSQSIVYGDLWELDLTPGQEQWHEIQQKGDLPPPKWLLRPAVDSVRDRLILFGGNSHPDWTDGDYRDTTYELDLATDTWILVPTVTPPSARGQYATVWDPVERQMHLFGGLYRVGPMIENVVTYNEIWTYDSDSQSWFQQLPSGPKPDIRRTPTAVFDQVNRRVIVFGGELIRPILQAQATICQPVNGREISGDFVSVQAEIAGEVSAVSQVLFEYRLPSISGTWQPISPASEHSNPDWDEPYFVHWDVTGLPEGPVDLRAVAVDVDTYADPAPDDITVTINHSDPELIVSVTDSGNIQMVYHVDNSIMADIGAANSGFAAHPNTGDANVRLRIPQDTFVPDSQVIAVFVDPADYAYLDPQGGSIGFAVEVDVTGGQENFPPGKAVTLIFHYPDADQDTTVDNTNILETTLSIYTEDGSGGLEELQNVVIDPFANTIQGETNHFSVFVVNGIPNSLCESWREY